ncbi:aspartate/glutamate racemase family protein [Nocardioides plantarum]|uniref:Aspartate/glutamate racemase family protein n=1 Tax=Nocardioides plantarum TaxID=29299 RepID=A0ABV5K6W5_9ACTN|nr:amino acid racemase [Nocardioides plantarum]
MQTIGLIGGMSWESSAVYYQALNRGVQQRYGGLSSAKTVLASVDLAEVTALQEQGKWDEVGDILAAAGRSVEAAGADFLLLATTTFHRVADQVTDAVSIPVLHLADVIAEAVKARGLDSVGFIAPSFAMSHDFFTARIASHGIAVHVPDAAHHEAVNRIVYDELVHGKVLNASRRIIVGLVDELWDAGAKGLVLGTTELELLVKQADVELPLFPATTLHVDAALARALG